MASIRVLVIEDSLTIRKYLVDVLTADPDFEVLGEAEDGTRAVELCETLRPDVVSMDMMLPVMSGLAATEHIMAYCPTPILIVSASINRGEVFNTYDALNAGAVDVMEKPTEAQSGNEWEQGYKRTLKLVARIKVITHPRARLPVRRQLSPARGFKPPQAVGLVARCVVIGASTGGPGAVVSILQDLPSTFPLPILLVLHIDAAFSVALSDWLATVSPIPVRQAVDGELMPCPGMPGVIIAPPDRHLVLHANRLWTTSDPERHFCRPSVDVLFESVAREMPRSVIACLLTGMGRDGAKGLLAIKQAGGVTIAQNQESCVVFGMPREAIRLNAARQVLPLNEIAPTLLQLAEPQPALL